MAKKGGGVVYVDYSPKKEVEDPVVPCQGWVDPCDFCDKRFGNWIDANEENIAKIPTKPGIFMIGLSHKNTVEVVDITLDATDLQKVAFDSIDQAKERVADKKTKVTKSVVVCRWVTFKSPNEKDVTSLCAHWYNNGVLPKFLNEWPGLDILEKTDNLVFSEELKKWCYPKKDAFWRKPKALPNKLVEVVESCNWTEPCEICDSYFGDWKSLEDVMSNELAPDTSGIYMIAVGYSKIKEVVNIYYDSNNIKLNIKDSLLKNHKAMHYMLREKKFSGRNPYLLVRWMEMNDPESSNCCFLYAHWLNAGSVPMACHSKLPGEQVVDRNKHFVVRAHDKKWCYEIDVLKPVKTSKSKQKKHIMSDLEDDLRDMNVAEFE
ncbi:unnamed protein product [Larinioides sclopetarius]|uniref:Uncharacterized protein n=1 Tax=Larinioides sclopetarius TaxID=280406 RepID=A0AAV2B5C4_9ARAC